MESKIEQYKQLHKQNNEYGSSSKKLTDEISLIVDFLKPKVILDYGCGKGLLVDELKKQYPDIQVYGYDPAIEGKNVLPVNKADLVINTDVLEHIPEEELEDTVRHIASLSKNVFFHLSHVLAVEILPNGENAHCTVKPLFWYYELFKKYFKTQTILEGRSPFLSVILTFPVSPDVYKKYYKILLSKTKN